MALELTSLELTDEDLRANGITDPLGPIKKPLLVDRYKEKGWLVIPGLIDTHVHWRVPGGEDKEDARSGSRAALKGGFTTVLTMGNTSPIPVASPDMIQQVRDIYNRDSYIRAGVIPVGIVSSIPFFEDFQGPAFALKNYYNFTTGNFLLKSEAERRAVMEAWDSDLPIVGHAEGRSLQVFLRLGKEYGRKLHIAHVSSEYELSIIMRAKDAGQDVTCEVSTEHLFLTRYDREHRVQGWAKMRPPLHEYSDRNFLRTHDDAVDEYASDHAPHKCAENELPLKDAPNGSPSLETSLPMQMEGIHEGWQTWENLLDKCHNNPKKIFNTPDEDIRETYVVVDPNEGQVVGEDGYETKAQGSPYHDRKVHGKVKLVVRDGQVVYDDSKGIIGEPRGGFITHKKAA